MSIKAKPKKVNHLEKTYWKAYKSALRSSWSLTGQSRVDYQKDIGFIHQRVMEYGFEFFPTHYIRDHVMEMKRLNKEIRSIVNAISGGNK